MVTNGLAAVLAVAAAKMLASRWLDITPAASLAIILAIVALTVSASLAVPGNRDS